MTSVEVVGGVFKDLCLKIMFSFMSDTITQQYNSRSSHEAKRRSKTARIFLHKLQEYLNIPTYLKISIIVCIKQIILIVSGLQGAYLKVLFYSCITLRCKLERFHNNSHFSRDRIKLQTLNIANSL